MGYRPVSPPRSFDGRLLLAAMSLCIHLPRWRPLPWSPSGGGGQTPDGGRACGSPGRRSNMSRGSARRRSA